MNLSSIRQTWFSNIRGDLLAGIVVALALIPEAIAFSIIAGLDPKVGLYASFSICVIIAFVGGRPGMISAATGAMALLMVTLVKEHGLQYLLAATILTGVLQILAGVLKLGLLMRFVSRSVVTGFVNALAILIFLAQLPELTNVGLAGVCHDSWGPCHHLWLPIHHQNRSLSTHHHCCTDGHLHGNGHGHPDGG
ncbi:SulP family inorganic anion transporter [Acidovorax sp. JHL-3]|uniref:SulP family inorganic anion transporter n=1 Tax=Acidovorax sp. JHL-3 TaxID=1276755 RepID=UPI001EE35543|nr:SulP family inorganic anion transporter [Acidovorax sp. JHL-3]